MKHLLTLAAVLIATVACSPGGGSPTPTPATSPTLSATLPPVGPGLDPAYDAACTTADPTIDELATALENFDPSADPAELERMLDDLASTLLFVEDTNTDTAAVAGTALTAISGISLAITNGESIADRVGPAASALRALETRVCG